MILSKLHRMCENFKVYPSFGIEWNFQMLEKGRAAKTAATKIAQCVHVVQH